MIHLLMTWSYGQMIKYVIKNRRIELTYETGLELKLIMKCLELFDIINEVKK